MCEALEQHLPTGGRRAKHCPEDRLLMTLMYWREYRTHAHIAQTYGLSESAVCRTIHAVENALLRSGEFTLPGKKALTKSDIIFEVVVMDATECPVERPQKSKSDAYSGKKKRHTQKAQIVADPKTGRILATAFSAGKMHDFKLFRQSRLAMHPQTECLADSGYLGLKKSHANSRLPHKKSKLHPLTEEQKADNRQLSRERFVIEHIIRSVKIFRILAERYRNRRKRFGLRFNLIAAIYNLGRPT